MRRGCSPSSHLQCFGLAFTAAHVELAIGVDDCRWLDVGNLWQPQGAAASEGGNGGGGFASYRPPWREWGGGCVRVGGGLREGGWGLREGRGWGLGYGLGGSVGLRIGYR